MSTTTSGPFCAVCGVERPDVPGMPADGRTPCPSCGAINVNYSVHAVATVRTTASASYTMRPGNQAHDWQLRWRLIEHDVAQVTGLRSGGVSADAIEKAERDLFEFFGSCYHLKDILIQDGIVPKQDMEDAITDDPDLAFLADLANLDKHHRLSKQPRSGDVPRYLERTASSAAGGWQLNVSMEHHGKTISAVEAATKSVDGWRRFLGGRGLL